MSYQLRKVTPLRRVHRDDETAELIQTPVPNQHWSYLYCPKAAFVWVPDLVVDDYGYETELPRLVHS